MRAVITCGYFKGVFNNASARSAITCFLSKCKRLSRRLQALVKALASALDQLDRCLAGKSKMTTKQMSFREGL